MSLVKINKVLDDILGRRFGIEGEAVSAERQLIIDVLMDFYKNDKDEFFVTESLKHLLEKEEITLFDLFGLIGAVGALKDKKKK